MPSGIEEISYSSYIFFDFFEKTTTLKYISSILAFIIYWGFGFFLVQKNTKLIIVESSYQIVGIFFVMFSGIWINSQKFIPEILAVIFLYFSVFKIFSSFKKENCPHLLFDIGFLYGISLIINLQFIYFLPFLIISIFIIKKTIIKEIIALIIGILTPILLYFSIIFLFFNYSEILSELVKSISNIFVNINFVNKFQTKYLLLFCPFFLLFLIMLVFNFTIKNKSIFSKKSQNILILFMVASIIFFCLPNTANESIITTFPPLSIVTAKIFVNINNKFKIILFYSILGVIIFLQILQIKILFNY
jgi:hypothetical protein